ncbi:MAG TPA: hypothetical protein VFN67_37455 [Polyangiales bacterium]|nr:hypothetical protein [Polyangiales bacterium]
MPYTPTPEFIAALDQIDALVADTNTPAPVASLATATKSGLMELAAKQQMLQTQVEEQQQQRSQQLQSAPSKQKQSAKQEPDDAEQRDGVIEAAPPPLSVPPGTYEAPRGNAAASGNVVSSYEPFRGDTADTEDQR